MVVTTQLLSFKTVLKLMCPLQESTIPSTCLTAEGELSITATPGLRFRLRVKAVLPLECPASKAEDYCPQVSANLCNSSEFLPRQGPCCGTEECSCQYLLGTEVSIYQMSASNHQNWILQPLALEHNKTGNCHYSLVSSPGSQVLSGFMAIFERVTL